MKQSLSLCLGGAFLASACSSGTSGGGSDATSADTTPSHHRDAVSDAHAGGADRTTPRDARHDAEAEDDAAADVSMEAGFDGPIPTTALLRLANWSPDAPGLDLCLAPHGTSIWSGPLLEGALGDVLVGNVVVTSAGLPIDAGKKRDASTAEAGAGRDSATSDAQHASDAANAADASLDARLDADARAVPSDGGHDASHVDSGVDAGPPTGVPFPRVSPYVSISPGDYDVRVIGAGTGCGSPLFPDVVDLPAIRAGATLTLAAAGDTVDQGTDPGLGLSVFSDDTIVKSGDLALRYVNAVPSVIETTFASGQVALGSAVSFIAAAQFGDEGVDTDAGVLDPNGYLAIPPLSSEVWSLIDANGGTITLCTVTGLAISAGRLVTVVGVGGESGAEQYDIGILVCIDAPPIAAGETASCTLLEEASLPVCAIPGKDGGAGILGGFGCGG